MTACHDCPLAPAVRDLAPPGSEAPPPRLTVALIGPPNAGKSTLFNELTGLRQKVANYAGVTVEHRIGRVSDAGGASAELIDLPGTISLQPRSEDERITDDVLHGRRPGIPKPQAVILVLDATQLGRHLSLAAPVLALGLPTLVVLNLADDLERRGGSVDVAELARRLGVPVALVSARQRSGLEPVRAFLAGRFGLPAGVELPSAQRIPACRAWAAQLASDSDWRAPAPARWSRRLDALFLHPWAGPLIFAAVVMLVFQGMFMVAAPLADLMERAIGAAGVAVQNALPAGMLRDLLVEGVWGGVGSVVVFLPQILVLFLFIGILEDSGYLARAALIADRTMARVGLQGKSFIPLLSAHACAVPAVLATRTIENRRDRLATILVAPFMTCAARLPVYTLIIAAFLPNTPVLGPFLGLRAAALIGLYVLGFGAAALTALLLKSTILKSDPSSFILELPPYRWPTLRALGFLLLDRARAFLWRAGTVILAVSVGLWVLTKTPRVEGHAPDVVHSVAGTIGRTIEPAIAPLGFDWKIGIGLVTSLAAREVIVATLGTIHGVSGDQSGLGLQRSLRRDLSPASAAALLVFFAFAMQCLPTLAVVRRETGGWRYPALQFSYMLALAWGGALAARVAVGAFFG